ncbi:hypothetical protein DCAR_0727796 [Daucus carota subsp. sativus]|uniref:Uncharacterized protein n=1 Tax=Daucus carota subsp. sativus TaxID=79200 RepID=A0AAF0XJV2_DAUCS|nr:PREDICTED: uncharacterized protein LOC108195765 [Daucus carota subsp. sativus]WOH08357.1 hypothetical protein DCAR_0727796 [Daucus carota subsp. sativus]
MKHVLCGISSTVYFCVFVRLKYWVSVFRNSRILSANERIRFVTLLSWMLVSLMLVIQIFSYIRLQGVILGSGSFSTFFIIKCFSAQKYSLGESCVVSSGPITSYQSSVTPFESMLSGVELTGQ